MTIDELIVSLGFEFDSKEKKELNDFKKNIKEGAKTLAKMTAVVIGMAAAVTAFVVKVAQGNDALGKQAELIGVTAEQLQEYAFAMEQTTRKGDSMAGMLEGLTNSMAAAAEGSGSGLAGFGRLGISVTDASGKVRNASEAFDEIVKKMQGLSDVEQRNIAASLGLTQALPLIRKGSVELQRLKDKAKELGIATKADTEAAAKFGDGLGDLWLIMKNISTLIAAKLMPVFMRTIEAMKKWIKANKEWLDLELANAVKVVGTAMFSLFKIIGFLAKSFFWLSKAVGGADNMMRIFITGFLLFASLTTFLLVKNIMGLFATFPGMIALVIKGFAILKGLIFSTFAAVALTAAAIGLFIEDIFTFIQGGDSLLGRLLDKFPLVKAVFEGIGDTLAPIILSIEEIFRFLSGGDFSAEAWKEIGATITAIFDDLTDKLADFFLGIADGIMDIVALLPGGGGEEAQQAGFANDTRATIRRGLAARAKRQKLRAINALKTAGVNSVVSAQTSSTSRKIIKTESKVVIEIKGDAGKLDAQELRSIVSKKIEEDIREGLRANETGIER